MLQIGNVWLRKYMTIFPMSLNLYIDHVLKSHYWKWRKYVANLNDELKITCLPILKHKDSFGKSQNLSKIFFAEILVFDHDYEGKSSSNNGLLWISFIYF